MQLINYCPRCSGTLGYDPDIFEWFCLSCSYREGELWQLV